MSELTRRELLIVAAATGCCGAVSGCKLPVSEPPRGTMDVGAPAEYPLDGVFDKYAKSNGIMMIRRNGEIIALSSICTHERCIVQTAPEGFKCPCHNSGYNEAGEVIRGPSIRHLDRYPIKLDAAGHLIVDTAKTAEDPANPGEGYSVKI